MTLQELLAIRPRQQRAAVERIDQQVLVDRQIGRLLRRPDQEMARKIHAFEPESGPRRDLQIDDRECDRNARAPRHDVVEKAVARIVVARFVAAEAFLVEQQHVERRDAIERARAIAERREPLGGAAAEAI